MLELFDLAVGLNDVVLESGHRTLLVLVCDLLGLGVDLLLSLTLTTLQVHEGNDVALGGEAALIDGGFVRKDGSAAHKSVDSVVDLVFNLDSIQVKKVTGTGSAGVRVRESVSSRCNHPTSWLRQGRFPRQLLQASLRLGPKRKFTLDSL